MLEESTRWDCGCDVETRSLQRSLRSTQSRREEGRAFWRAVNSGSSAGVSEDAATGASIRPSDTAGSVLPSTVHEEAPVLALGGKRLRMTAAELLESEGDVDATDLEEFVDRMESMNVEAGPDEWNRLWKQHAEQRLRDHGRLQKTPSSAQKTTT